MEGRYEIERELGQGGTAIVYLAVDVRHGRKVALKVLKPELAAVVGAERFLAEVKTTARLQHPRILPLFDSGEAGGFLYHVTPHVSGESLRDRLDREGQLPVDEAVRIAIGVAEALDSAHRNGIIHRDIKPANVLLQDGQPVVADFGIALAIGPGTATRMTQTGVSVGTPQYMSPEQATGDMTVGPAADIYALGCVLYEMLTGEPPFTGSTPQAILGKIVSGKAALLTERRPTVPEHVSGATAKALEKVPADRFRAGVDFARALGDPAFRWPVGVPAARRRARSLALAAGAGALGAALLFALWSGRAPASTDDGQTRTALSIRIPDDQVLALGNPSTLEISPDGTRIAYVAEQEGRRRVFLRGIGDFDVRALPATDGAWSLFFSPDGSQIGFWADGELRRLAVDGGLPTRITAVPGPPVGASWGADGTILYALGSGTTSLWRVSATGGTPSEIPLVIDSAYARERPHLRAPNTLNILWPQHLPREDLALVVPGYDGSVGVVDLTTGLFRPLVDGNRPYYVPSGHIVYYSGPEQVSVVPFDLDRLEVTGPAVPVADDVLRPSGSEGRFSVSRTGTLVYARGGFERQIMLVERSGREAPLGVEPRGYRFPAVSPDGRWLAVTVDPQPPQIWIIDLLRKSSQPVSSGGYHLQPVWDQSGSRLAFSTNPGIAMMDWPGSGALLQVSTSGFIQDWPRADIMLVGTVGVSDVGILNLVTDSLVPWIATSAGEAHATHSPDGAWVAYMSTATGTPEVYVRAFLGSGPDVLVSAGGGREPVWSADGSEIFYRNGSSIVSVSVRTAPRFEVLGSPEILFSDDYDFSNDQNWDVLPDGRFVMIRSSPGVGREIRVISNWLN